MNSPEAEQPTRNAPMSYAEAEQRMQAMAMRIRAQEKEAEKAIEDAANAEAIYRKALGDKFRELRGEGLAVEAANTQARGELWTLSRERDFAIGKVRLAMERLEDRRGERHSLHKLVDWSGGLDVIPQGVRGSNDGSAG